MNKELLTIKDMFMSSLEEFAYKYPDEKIFTIFISCEPIYGSVFINIDTYDHSQKSIEWLKMKNHNDWIGVDKNGNFNNDGFDSKYIKFKEKYFEDWYNSYWNREEDECIFDILDEIKDSNNFKEYLEKNIENIEASFNNNFNKKYIVKDYFDNKIEINISGDDDEYNKYYFDLIKVLINEIMEKIDFKKYNTENSFRVILEMLDSKHMEIWNINQ